MKWLTIFLLLATLVFGDAYSELGYSSDYEKSLQEAKDSGKLLMLLVVTQVCPWCKKFSSKTLQNSEIKTYISEHFVPVIVDRERDKARFPQTYQTPRVPAIFYIDPAGHEVWTTVGYRTPKELLEEFEEANLSYIELLTGVTY